MTMMRIGCLAAALCCATSLQAQTFLTKDASAWAAEVSASAEARRRSAAFALGKLGSTAYDAVPALRRAMQKDQSPKVREAAAFALGEIARESIKAAADPQLVPMLTAALKDEHWTVRR